MMSVPTDTIGASSPERPRRYTYTPLGTTNRQIRLLKIERASRINIESDKIPRVRCASKPPRLQGSSQPIRGSLQTFTVDAECPRYQALSYEWGLPSDKLDILVDGSLLQIWISLANFLYYFRASDLVDEYIWVDQICINQTDIPERNFQVSLMDEVYQRAFRVIAFLGSGSHTTSALQYLVEGLHRNIRFFWREKPETLKQCRYVYEASIWTRLWIQQEIFLAREVVLMAKDTTILASRFLNEFPRGQQPWVFGEFRRGFGKPTRYLDLLEGLKRFSQNKCQDPRDRVYGVLGMVEPASRIAVDYSLSTEQVFVSVLERMHTMHSTDRWPPLRVADMLRTLGEDMGLSLEIQRRCLSALPCSSLRKHTLRMIEYKPKDWSKRDAS